MPRRLRPSLRHLCGGFALAALFGAAQAAELGESVVRSFIGQPLAADIELTALTYEEANALQVSLADSDVYRGANIRMDPALDTLHIALMRRDGRQFLHLTSRTPVETDYLHVFLSLRSGEAREVRAATLWLIPDPQAPAQTGALAAAAPPPRPVWHTLAPRHPGHKHADSVTEAQLCAAAEARNAQLSGNIAKLEGKVSQLQTAVGVKPVAPPASAPAAHAAAQPGAGHAHASTKAGHEGKAGLEKKGMALWPWPWIGGGVGAVLLAGVLAYVFRSKTAGKAKPRAADKASLWARLRGKKKPAPIEPVLDGAAAGAPPP
ncbi:MAG: hypothetical protein V4582_01565 [Pseudomonadota bacterium]